MLVSFASSPYLFAALSFLPSYWASTGVFSLNLLSSKHYWNLTSTAATATKKDAGGGAVKSPAKSKTPRKKKANGAGSEAGTPSKKRKISKAEDNDADDEQSEVKGKDEDEGFAALVKTQKAGDGEGMDEDITA